MEELTHRESGKSEALDPNSLACVRARVFSAASKLFYQKGIRVVSVELIAKEAATTKMTLYRYFPSKEQLVVEWLDHHNEAFNRYLDELNAKFPLDPRARLRAYFENSSKLIADPDGRGCPIANAAVELTEPDHPARQVIASHKSRLYEFIKKSCEEIQADAPTELADALFMMCEGAYLSMQTIKSAGPGKSLVAAFERLLNAHLNNRNDG